MKTSSVYSEELDRGGRPKVALLGKNRSWNRWLSDLADAFADCGVRAHTINITAMTPGERWREEGRHLNNPSILKRVSRELDSFNPDLVLVLNHAGLSPKANEALRKVLRPKIACVGWLSDRIEGLPLEEVPALDGVYSFDSSCEPALHAAYAGRSVRIQYLPLAASPKRFPFSPPSGQRKPSLVFAGHATAKRQVVFRQYRQLGGRLDLHGPRCGTWLRPWRGMFVSPARMGKLFRSHIACMNLLTRENTLNGLNLRAFEIPMSGGVGTYPDVLDVRTCFVPGVEILLYRTLEELKASVDELIARPEKAEAIAEAGRQRVLREHTWHHRAARILKDWFPDAPIVAPS